MCFSTAASTNSMLGWMAYADVGHVENWPRRPQLSLDDVRLSTVKNVTEWSWNFEAIERVISEKNAAGPLLNWRK